VSIEDILRRSAGLRLELEAVVAAGSSAELLYEGPLSTLEAQLRRLADSCRLGGVLAAAGKDAEGGALRNAAEALRTAAKEEVPALLVKLHRLAASLLRVPGVPGGVAAELGAVSELLGDTIEEVAEGMAAAGLEVPPPVLRFISPELYGGASASGSGASGGGSVAEGGSAVGGTSRVSFTRGRQPAGEAGAGAGAAGRRAVSGSAGSGGRDSRGGGSPLRGGASVAGLSALGGGGGTGRPTGGSRQSVRQQPQQSSRRSVGPPGTHASARKSVAGGASVRSGSQRRAGSVSGGGSSRRRGGSRGQQRTSIASEMTDSRSAAMARIMHLPTVREIQRRLAVVASASELPAPVVAVLAAMLEACGVQAAANAAVDAVVDGECRPLLEEREAAGTALLREVAMALDDQVRSMSAATDRVATWFAEVAQAIATHAAAHAVADSWVEAGLSRMHMEFEDDDAALAGRFDAAAVRLARAPTLPALEARFGDAMAALSAIEARYRALHADTAKWGSVHPARVAATLRGQRASLAFVFGLALPPLPAGSAAPATAAAGPAEPGSAGPAAGSRPDDADGEPLPGEVEAVVVALTAQTQAQRQGLLRDDVEPAASAREGHGPALLQALSSTPRAATGGPAALALQWTPAGPAPPLGGSGAATGGYGPASSGSAVPPPDSPFWRGIDTTAPPPGFTLRQLYPFLPAPAMAAEASSGGGGLLTIAVEEPAQSTQALGQTRPLGASATLSPRRSGAAQTSAAAAGAASRVYAVRADASLLAAYLIDAQATTGALALKTRLRSAYAARERLGVEVAAAQAQGAEAEAAAHAKLRALPATLYGALSPSAAEMLHSVVAATASGAKKDKDGKGAPAAPKKLSAKDEAEVAGVETACAAATTAQEGLAAAERSLGETLDLVAELEAEAAGEGDASAAASAGRAAAAAGAGAGASGSGLSAPGSGDGRRPTLRVNAAGGTPGGVSGPHLAPRDSDGNLCVAPVAYPRAELARMLDALRRDVLRHFERFCCERRRLVRERADALAAASAAQLEDRLRQHWPRKGALEVSVRAPRAGQIVAHRERLDRFLRQLQSREAGVEEAFQRDLATAAGLLPDATQQLQALQSTLPSLNTLAALQGVMARCRQIRSQYEAAFGAASSGLQAAASQQLQRTRAAAAEFLASCALFPEQQASQPAQTTEPLQPQPGAGLGASPSAGPQTRGLPSWSASPPRSSAAVPPAGDAHSHTHRRAPSSSTTTHDGVVAPGASGAEYDAEEVAAFAAQVAAQVAASEALEAERMDRVRALSAAYVDTLPRFEELAAAQEAALKALSLREGLGQKYGQPRRIAQEALRSAAAQSEAAAAAIADSLAELQALLAASRDGTPMPPLSDEERLAIWGAARLLPSRRAAAETEAAGSAAAGAAAAAPPSAGASGKAAAAGKTTAPAAGAKGGAVAKSAKEGAKERDAATAAGPSTDAPAASAAAEALALQVTAAHMPTPEPHALPPVPLSVRLRRVTVVLRDRLYARARSLQAFKTAPDIHGPLRPFFLPTVDLADTPLPTPLDAVPSAARAALGGRVEDSAVASTAELAPDGGVPPVYLSVHQPGPLRVRGTVPAAWLAASQSYELLHHEAAQRGSDDALSSEGEPSPRAGAVGTPGTGGVSGTAAHTVAVVREIKGMSPGPLVVACDAAAAPAAGAPAAAAGGAAADAPPAPVADLTAVHGLPPHVLPPRPFMDAVAAALDACRAATLALFAAEGQPIPDGDDAALPQSLRDFMGRERLRAAELREYSLRGFRVQVQQAQEALAAAPPALLADVEARCRADAVAWRAASKAALGRQLAQLERQRQGHVARLKASLGDARGEAALAALAEAEAVRVQTADALLSAAQEAEGHVTAVAVAACAARLAHTAASFCLAAEEVVCPEDLAPLPGDETAAPAKPSVQRLHKSVRKAGAEAAAALAAAALGGDVGAIVLDERGEVVAPPLAEAGAGPAPADAAVAAAAAGKETPAAGGKGAAIAAAAAPAPARGGKATPAGAASAGKDRKGATVAAAAGSASAGEAAPPPAVLGAAAGVSDRALRNVNALREWHGVGTAAAGGDGGSPRGAAGSVPWEEVGALTCRYAAWSRHAIRGRDDALHRLVAATTAESEGARRVLAQARADLAEWTAVWGGRVALLRGNAEPSVSAPAPPTAADAAAAAPAVEVSAPTRAPSSAASSGKPPVSAGPGSAKPGGKK
jgi:hypothetical protein